MFTTPSAYNNITGKLKWLLTYPTRKLRSIGLARNMPLMHVLQKLPPIDLLLTPVYPLPYTVSGITKACEKRYGLGQSIYFYAGRASTSFGSVASAFSPKSIEGFSGSATPFDTGAVCAHVIHIQATSNITPERLFRDFEVPLAGWQKAFTKHLVKHFFPLSNYWTSGPSAVDPPPKLHPDITYQAYADWRIWAFEVRTRQAPDFFDAIAWCCNEAAERELDDRIANISSLNLTLVHAVREIQRRYIPRNGRLDHAQTLEDWARRRLGI